MDFEGTASWKSVTEGRLIAKGKEIATAGSPPLFGGKERWCATEDILAVSLD